MEEDTIPSTTIRICRLCFSLISDKNFFPITGSLKDMVKVITSDLNLDVTDFPLMCSECLNLVQDVFNFKTNFFESEEKIESKLPDRNLKLNLTTIMDNYSFNCRPKRKSTEMKLKRKKPRKKLCRTCLEEIKEHFIVLDNRRDVTLSQMLESCLSELDLKLTSNPVMCLTCYDTLQKMSMFKLMCKENECKIEDFLKSVDKKYHRNVNLHSVLQFSSNINKSTNSTKIEHIKIEPKYEYEGEYSVQDCLDYVMVKMEPNDEAEDSSTTENVFETKSEYKSRSRSPNMQGEQNRTRKKRKMEKTTHCPDCNFKTKYKTNLRAHLIGAHQRKDVKLGTKYFRQCPQCDFATRWNLDLTRHMMLSHVNPDAFQCPRCPYSSNHNTIFIKHILSHVNDDTGDKNRFFQVPEKTV